MQCVVITAEFFFFTRVTNPDFEPSMLGAPSVHTPINFSHERFSSWKNLDTMFMTSSAFVVNISDLQKRNSSFILFPETNRAYTKSCDTCCLIKLNGKELRLSYFFHHLKFDILGHVIYSPLN